MTRWAMIIDLHRCIGCKCCVQACTLANQVPEGLWRKCDEIGKPVLPDRRRLFITRNCMHCDNPPCNKVCPTGATYQRPDGIVDIDYERCVGCGYCIIACPYHARVIYQYTHDFEKDTSLHHKSKDQKHDNREGICTKCNFCVTRIENGLKRNLMPGVDSEATPFCVVACSCGALSFGDLDDPKSSVSQMIKERPTLRLSAEIETDPSVYYIIE